MAFEKNGSNTTPKGKGTNGGKRTIDNKNDDFINAVDNGANAAKAITTMTENKENKRSDGEKKQVSDSITVYNYENGILINKERKAK